MELETLDLEPRRYAYVRHVGPYNSIGATFGRMCGTLAPTGLFAQPGVSTLAVYHDDPRETPEPELRADAAVFLPDGFPVPEGMEEGVLPAGHYVRHVYRGSYEGLGDAWGRLVGDEVPAAGHVPDERPSFEVYRNDPLSVPPQELLTDLYVPVRAPS